MGLHHLIEGSQPQMAVIGTACDTASLLNHPALAEADLLLLDLNLGQADGANIIPALRKRSRAHILILTGDDDGDRHRAAMVAGARGVLHKAEPARTILNAIDKVHHGEIWLNRSMLGDVLGQLTGHSPAAVKPPSDTELRIAKLTQREREIVRLLSQSASAKLMSVAADLGLSENTLRNHLTTIYSKLGVRGRLELHVFASAQGIDRPTVAPGTLA